MKFSLKRIIVCLFVCTLFFLVGCGGNNTTTEATLSLDKESVVLSPKEEYEIIYTLTNGSELDVEFESENEKIATVDEAGYITAKKGGDTTVTVKVSLEDGTVLEKSIKVSVGYTITLTAGTGATVEPKSVFLTSSESYTLPIPTKNHAEFLGWSIDNGKTYITELTNVTENTVVRAYWKNQYLVKYELNGGSYESQDEYVFEGTQITLSTPTKDGNKFLGWGLSKTSSSYVNVINVNSNTTLYAIWEPQRVELSFDCDEGTYTGRKYALYGDTLELGTPHKFGYTFKGWTLTKGSTDYISKLENITESVTLYAAWEEGNTNAEFMVTNLPDLGIPYLTSLQLELAYSAASLKTAKVSYTSSDTDIFTVSSTGNVETVGYGVAYLTVEVKGSETLTQEIEIIVYNPGRFDVSYETVSYTEVGQSIQLNAKYYNRAEKELEVEFRSSTPSVATVTTNGVVTGVSVGTATIVAYVKNDTSLSFEFLVTVIGSGLSDAMKLVLDSHESNVFVRYELGIGAGTPVYYMDIIGSVNKLLFTNEYYVDRSWEATQAAIDYNHGGVKTSTEFIVVHYTGNMSKGADGNANAGYFASGGNGTSVHYVTGNDGIYSCLADDLVGFHAGDSTDVTFEWIPSGVMVKEGDPEYPVFEISENSKYIINGQETTIDVPTGNATKSPNTVRVTGNTFLYNGIEQNCINDMGLPFTIVNGEYYMGTTWWCYTQVAAGRLCSKGGNLNSIGIESAVNEGSDLWYTWHLTAQLVAHLMRDNSLDITRVRGHHFWSAKDCPQPMLENNLEIWYHFRDMIEAEYAKLTEFSDYKFEYVGLSGIDSDTERVTQEGNAKLITYKVKVSKGGVEEEITLGCVCNGLYGKTY